MPAQCPNLLKFLKQKGQTKKAERFPVIKSKYSKRWKTEDYHIFTEAIEPLIIFFTDLKSNSQHKELIAHPLLNDFEGLCKMLRNEKPPTGFFSNSNNVKKMKNSLSSYRQKNTFNKLFVVRERFQDIKFTSDEKKWLSREYAEISEISEKLDTTLKKIINKLRLYEETKKKDLERVSRIFILLNENVTHIADFIRAVAEDFKLNGFSVPPLSSFSRTKIQKRLGLLRLEKQAWFMEDWDTQTDVWRKRKT